MLRDMDFKPCKMDPQVWYKPTKDGDCYEYVAVYMDDLALAMEDCKAFCEVLIKKYKFKLKGEGPLCYHLGCDYEREPDGVLCATPKKYIHNQRKATIWQQTDTHHILNTTKNIG